MLSEIDCSLECLGEIAKRHSFVDNKTGTLHSACEKLIEDQTKLVNVAESISQKLSYFDELDRISSRLNTPTLSVTSDTFSSTLARLDECIAFIGQNPHFHDSQMYLARFRRCLSRALSLIKQYVVTTLKNATKSVVPKQGTVETLSEENYGQYYGKFRTNAPRIKALMKEIESRTKINHEYHTLLEDCRQCYLTQRSVLLMPCVIATVEEIKKLYSTDHCGLLRAGCNVLCRVCQDEFQLFFHFFNEEAQELNSLLESICYKFYDTMRPVVIHVNHLETLAELSSILKAEMLSERVNVKAKELSAFGIMVQQLLQDVHQRLVFRAQKYIETDIRGYLPSPGDLAYPEKLVIAADVQPKALDTPSDSDSVIGASETEQVSTDTLSKKQRTTKMKEASAVDMHAMWYPTVRRTLLCLSKLYRCLEKPVFEGLAQEALLECVHSLQTASNMIASKKTDVDGYLFLIKHLLIVREQIAAFDVDFVITDVSLDFTKTKAAAYGLLKKRSRLFSMGSSNAVLEFFLEGIPSVVETHLNSKKEVDVQLKQSCEHFISAVSLSLVQPVKTLMSKYSVVLELATKEGHDVVTLLHKQPFAKADEVHKGILECTKLMKGKVPALKISLSLYLANEDTELILFRPIKAHVLHSFDALERIVQQYYSTEDQQIISCPTQNQVLLLLALE
eukprot:Em0021g563a